MAIELGTAYISIVPETKDFKRELEQQVNDAGSQIVNKFKGHGRKAGAGFGSAFGSELSSSLPGIGALKRTMAGYEGAASKAGAVAGKALGTAFTAAATAGIAGLGYTLFKGFERYTALDTAKHRLDNINKSLQQMGKAGVDAADIMKQVNDVVEGTPYSLSDAFSIATQAISSEVKDIKRFMTDVADAAAFASTDIASIGQAFTLVVNQGKVDAGILQNQLAGLPLRSWLAQIYEGVDITKALREGRIGIEQLQYAVEKFASNMAKSAGDTIQGSIMNLQTAFARLGAHILGALFGDPVKDGANGLKSAIDAIRAKIDEADKWVVAHGAEIKKAFTDAIDIVRQLIDVLGGIKKVIDEFQVSIGGVVTAFMAWKSIAGVTALMESLGGANTMLRDTLPASAASGAAKISAALGPVAALLASMYALSGGRPQDYLSPGGPNNIGNAMAEGDWGRVMFGDAWDWMHGRSPWSRPEEAPQEPISTGTVVGNDGKTYQTYPPGTNVGGQDVVPVPGKNVWGVPASSSAPTGGREPGWGGAPSTPLGAPPPLQDASGSGGGKGDAAKRPPKPVVPFNQNLPAWAAGTPETASFYQAETSWLNARHDLEEKRAYLNQLEQDNTATAEEIQDARNDVLQQERDMHHQDMQLQDAKRKAFEEYYKSGSKQADSMQALGDRMGDIVSLDQDLGISRGLVGLADNLLRFLAGLAAAPIKGLLAGVTQHMQQFVPQGWPGSGGGGSGGGGMSGLFPSLGISGGLGSLSTPGDIAAGATRLNALMGVAGALQGTPYSQELRNDCSGMANQLVNAALGLPAPPAGQRFTTVNQGDYLRQHGFLPGVGPEGSFQIGWNPQPGDAGHTAITLPNGMAADTNGPGGTYRIGPGAGAFQKQFTRQAYLPPQLFQPFGARGYSGGGDVVPAMLTPGEHVLTTGDVSAMGGQSAVYGFRRALHMAGGGGVYGWMQDVFGAPPSDTTGQSTPQGPPSTMGSDQPGGAGASGVAGIGEPPAPFGSPSQFAPNQAPLGLDPNTGQHGLGMGAAPGPGGPDGTAMTPQDAAQAALGQQLAGFIPQAAKANTVAGTSNLSRIWMMGADVINGILDQAQQAAGTAAAAGLAAGTMGAGAAGSPAAAAAANFAIGLGTEAVKRSVSYWAQMGGIASDAAVAQLFPLGAPHWFGFDSAQNSLAGLIQENKKAGVFDSGGMLPPGGMALNMSARPEPVLTQQQWDAMTGVGGATPNFGINIENVSVQDVNELSRSLSARQQLAAMQYSGRPY